LRAIGGSARRYAVAAASNDNAARACVCASSADALVSGIAASRSEPHAVSSAACAYAARVAGVEAAQRRSAAPGGALEGADEDELYVERLGGGLYTLERLACILGAAFATGHAGIRERTLLQMELSAGDADADGDGDGDGDGDAREARLLRPVRDVLETHAENIGDADGEEEQMRRRMRVVKLIVALGGGREEAAGE